MIHRYNDDNLQYKQNDWEYVRKETRKIENQLNVQLDLLSNICRKYYNNLDKQRDEYIEENICRKFLEIKTLITNLSDKNEELSNKLRNKDIKSHVLKRHSEILHDFTKEAKKLHDTFVHTKNRAILFSESSETTALSGVQIQGNIGISFRERNGIYKATNGLSRLLEDAKEISFSLKQQKKVFWGLIENISGVIKNIPYVSALIKTISKKKTKHTIILSFIIFLCLLLIISYVNI